LSGGCAIQGQEAKVSVQKNRWALVAVTAGVATLCSCADASEADHGECRPGEQVECDCDDGGADEDPRAFGRFCHSLTYGSAETDLHLAIGTGESAVALTASTWECGPTVGQGCAEIPVGDEVPVVLSSDAEGELFSNTYLLEEGEAYRFEACEDQGEVYILDSHFAAVEDCHDMTYPL
jgi:hypothetical protein